MIEPVQPSEIRSAQISLPRWVPVFCVCYLAVQIDVPLYQFNQPRSARFGWQMYSGLRKIPQVQLVFENGEIETVENLSQYFGRSRIDLQFQKALPKFLCETDPRVKSVLIENLKTDQMERCECP